MLYAYVPALEQDRSATGTTYDWVLWTRQVPVLYVTTAGQPVGKPASEMLLGAVEQEMGP